MANKEERVYTLHLTECEVMLSGVCFSVMMNVLHDIESRGRLMTGTHLDALYTITLKEPGAFKSHLSKINKITALAAKDSLEEKHGNTG